MYIRVFHIKRIHADDYFFCVATLTLIAGAGLLYAFIGEYYFSRAVGEGRTPPPVNFEQEVADAATYGLIAEVLCWTTIFSIKMSFLVYFRPLVNRLHKVELWWWFNIVALVPIGGVIISGPFIVCPYAGQPLLRKRSPNILLAG